MVRRWKDDFCPHQSPKCTPKMWREMHVAVMQDRLWNTEVADNMVKKQRSNNRGGETPSPRPKEQGIRRVNLENLSTATNKPVYPWQTGKGPIKSMVHCSNLTDGIGRGCNKPEGAEVWPFTHWHVSQWRTKDVTCWAKRGHQTHYDNAQITFLAPKCMAVDVQCSVAHASSGYAIRENLVRLTANWCVTHDTTSWNWQLSET